MKKTAILLACAMISGIASAAVVVSDDFDDGNLDGWNQKWTASQNGLFSNTGTSANMSGLAEVNYHAFNTAGFSLSAGEIGYVRSDYQFDHTGIAPTAVNQNAIGFLLTDTLDWWNGVNATWSLVNRGAAVGSRLPVSPWVEGWVTWGNLGIDQNVGGVGTWVDIEWELTVSGGTYWGQATVNHGGGSWTATAQDLGIAEGTTVYAGYSTGWNGAGTNMLTSASMNNVAVDNFEVEVIPEPATLGLLGLSSLALYIRRKIMS